MLWCFLSGSISSVGWLFDKKGKVVFAAGESGHTLDQMMDSAIEAGAEDIAETEEEGLVEVKSKSHVSSLKRTIFLKRKKGYLRICST